MELSKETFKQLFNEETGQDIDTITEIVKSLILLKEEINDQRASILNEIDLKLAHYGETYFMNHDFQSHKESLSHITELEIMANKVLRTQIQRVTKLFHTLEVEELKEHHMHLAYLAASLEKLDERVLHITQLVANRLIKEYAFIQTSHLATFVDYFYEFKKEFHIENEMKRVVISSSFLSYKQDLKKMKDNAVRAKAGEKDYSGEITFILKGYLVIELFVNFYNPDPKDIKFVSRVDTVLC